MRTDSEGSSVLGPQNSADRRMLRILGPQTPGDPRILGPQERGCEDRPRSAEWRGGGDVRTVLGPQLRRSSNPRSAEFCGPEDLRILGPQERGGGGGCEDRPRSAAAQILRSANPQILRIRKSADPQDPQILKIRRSADPQILRIRKSADPQIRRSAYPQIRISSNPRI